MSEIDPLDAFMRDATAAARDRAADGADDGAATRLRIRESMTRPAPRRRFTLIAAVIATMFGGTAFAYVAAVKAGWVESPFHHEAPAPVVAPTPPPEKVATQPRKPVPEVAQTPADVIGSTTIETPTAVPVDASLGIAADQTATVEVPAAPTPPPAPVITKTIQPIKRPMVVAPKATPRVEARPAVTALVPNPPAPVEPTPIESTPVPIEKAPAPQQVTQPAKPVEVAPSAELAAYRHAHELHFRGGDPKAALSAWDDYLKKYPSGSLAPDARYDRAILLVKLGRYADARAALAPFANAAPGSYKQKEAAELVEAIKDR